MMEKIKNVKAFPINLTQDGVNVSLATLSCITRECECNIRVADSVGKEALTAARGCDVPEPVGSVAAAPSA